MMSHGHHPSRALHIAVLRRTRRYAGDRSFARSVRRAGAARHAGATAGAHTFINWPGDPDRSCALLVEFGHPRSPPPNAANLERAWAWCCAPPTIMGSLRRASSLSPSVYNGTTTSAATRGSSMR